MGGSIEQIREVFSLLLQREAALRSTAEISERILKNSRQAMRLLHAGKVKDAEGLLREAEALLGKEVEPSLWRAYVLACQEYAEAKFLWSLLRGKSLPSPGSLRIPPESYLLGLLDLVGELRRLSLNALIKGQKRKALKYFSLMEEIHEASLPIILPKALIPELRRKQDLARAMVESMRSILAQRGKG